MRVCGVEFLRFERPHEELASPSLSVTRPLPHVMGGAEIVTVPFLSNRPVATKDPAVIALRLLATKVGDAKCGN
jgi:hypothetical protein